MNILIINKSPIVPYTGGVQRVTDILGKEFQKKGHNVTYMSYRHEEMMSFENFSAPQIYYPVKNKSQKIIKQELSTITKKLSTSHIIIQVYTKESLLIAKCLPEQLNDKIIFSSHIIPFGIESITRKRIFGAKVYNFKQLLFKLVSTACPSIKIKYNIYLEKKLFEEAFTINARYCFLSKLYFDNVLRFIPNAPVDRFVAISNPNSFTIEKDDIIPYASREHSVVWVGRVEDVQKNIFGFLKMWRIFIEDHHGWNAYVVGDGSDLDKCKKYVAKHKIQGVHFEGLQKDVSKYYNNCRFLCLTSFGESWGMILTEAMSFGCIPIAMDNFLVLHDIIDDKINGYICGNKPYDMAKTLSDAINNELICCGISYSATKKVQRYNSFIVVNDWLKILNSL